MDSDDEEGPVVEGWSIFEKITDSSSSETTLGLDARKSPIWEDRLKMFLPPAPRLLLWTTRPRRRKKTEAVHEAGPSRARRAAPAAATLAHQAAAPPPRTSRAPVTGSGAAARLSLFRT